MVTEPSGPLADVEQGQVNGMGSDEDSSSSWVAEDGAGPHGATPTTRHTAISAATSTPHPAPGPTAGPAPAELTVEKMVNPVFTRDPHRVEFRKSGSGFTAHVLRSQPLLTSTPQLSPLSEVDEERQPHLKPDISHHDNCDGYRGDKNSHHGNQMGSQNSVASKMPSIPEQSPFHTAPPSVSGASSVNRHQ